MVGSVEQRTKHKQPRAELRAAVQIGPELEHLLQLAAHVAGSRHTCSEEQRQAFLVHHGGVHVSIDQTGQYGLPLQIDHRGVAPGGDVRAADRADSLTLDDDRNPISGLSGYAVDQPRVSKNNARHSASLLSLTMFASSVAAEFNLNELRSFVSVPTLLGFPPAPLPAHYRER